MSQPSNRHPLSRATSALRFQPGMTLREPYTSPSMTGVNVQSQAMRRAVSAGIGCAHSSSAARAPGRFKSVGTSTVTNRCGFCPPTVGSAPCVQLTIRHLDQRIRPPLRRRPLVICRGRRHQGIERGLQRGPVVGAELAVEHERAAERLAQVQDAALMRLVGLIQHAVGFDAVPKMHHRHLQPRRV